MSTYTWGAGACAHPFTHADLRRLGRELRATLAGFTYETGEDPVDQTRTEAGKPDSGKGRKRRSRGEHEHGPWGSGPGGFGPWGPPGGPFGEPGEGPRRGPRGRGPGWRFEGPRGRAGRGDIRLAILALLAEGPRHGYQLIQEITERSDGAWSPSPGSIYPALSALQDEGLIDDEKVDSRRVFSLTEQGRAYVEQRAAQVAAVFDQNAPSSDFESFAQLRGLLWGVAEAAATVMGTGTDEQREQARQLLARTRRDLFRILAEEPATPAEEPVGQDGPAPTEPSDGADLASS